MGKNIAVLASGSGTNAENIIRYFRDVFKENPGESANGGGNPDSGQIKTHSVRTPSAD